MANPADGVIDRQPRRASLRLDHRALAEGADLALVVGFLLVYIWIIEPRTQAYAWPGLALFLTFTFLSHRRHGDTSADLGIRLDTFRVALAGVAVVFTPALLLTLVIGLYLGSGSHVSARHIALSLLGGYPWALFQQYGLQCVIGRRLRALIPHAAAHDIVCAAIFAALHLPNLFLTVVTFGAGYCFCALFRRSPNLFALALAHVVASTVLYHALPPAMTHLMRVGPGYYQQAGLD